MLVRSSTRRAPSRTSYESHSIVATLRVHLSTVGWVGAIGPLHIDSYSLHFGEIVVLGERVERSNKVIELCTVGMDGHRHRRPRYTMRC